MSNVIEILEGGEGTGNTEPGLKLTLVYRRGGKRQFHDARADGLFGRS